MKITLLLDFDGTINPVNYLNILTKHHPDFTTRNTNEVNSFGYSPFILNTINELSVTKKWLSAWCTHLEDLHVELLKLGFNDKNFTPNPNTTQLGALEWKIIQITKEMNNNDIVILIDDDRELIDNILDEHADNENLLVINPHDEIGVTVEQLKLVENFIMKLRMNHV